MTTNYKLQTTRRNFLPNLAIFGLMIGLAGCPSPTPPAPTVEVPQITVAASIAPLIIGTAIPAPGIVIASKSGGGDIASCEVARGSTDQLPSESDLRLTVNKGNCVITGTPTGTMSRTYNVKIVARNSGGISNAIDLVLTLIPADDTMPNMGMITSPGIMPDEADEATRDGAVPAAGRVFTDTGTSGAVDQTTSSFTVNATDAGTNAGSMTLTYTLAAGSGGKITLDKADGTFSGGTTTWIVSAAANYGNTEHAGTNDNATKSGRIGTITTTELDASGSATQGTNVVFTWTPEAAASTGLTTIADFDLSVTATDLNRNMDSETVTLRTAPAPIISTSNDLAQGNSLTAQIPLGVKLGGHGAFYTANLHSAYDFEIEFISGGVITLQHNPTVANNYLVGFSASRLRWYNTSDANANRELGYNLMEVAPAGVSITHGGGGFTGAMSKINIVLTFNNEGAPIIQYYGGSDAVANTYNTSGGIIDGTGGLRVYLGQIDFDSNNDSTIDGDITILQNTDYAGLGDSRNERPEWTGAPFSGAGYAISETPNNADETRTITGTVAGTDDNNMVTYGIAGGTVANGMSTLVGMYGSLQINTSTGAWTYSLGEGGTTQTTIDAEAQDSGTGTDAFTLTLSDGQTPVGFPATVNTTLTVAVTFAGEANTDTGPIWGATLANTGTVTTGTTTITETDHSASESNNNVTGSLTARDREGDTITYGIMGTTMTVNANEISQMGKYGTFQLTTGSGAWTYHLGLGTGTLDRLNNANFGDGATSGAGGLDAETFIVTAASTGTGSSEQSIMGTITITVNGKDEQNAPPEWTGNTNNGRFADVNISEDSGSAAETGEIGRILTTRDDESDTVTYGIQGETPTSGATTVSKTGQYGTLVLTIASGLWTYHLGDDAAGMPDSTLLGRLNHPAFDSTAPKYTEIFTFTATDGQSGSGRPITIVQHVIVQGADE